MISRHRSSTRVTKGQRLCACCWLAKKLVSSWWSRCYCGVRYSIVWKKNPEKSKKDADLGSGEVWGTIVTLNLKKRRAPTLNRIILLHFGLVTVRSHVKRTRNTIHLNGFQTQRTWPWLLKSIWFISGDTNWLKLIQEKSLILRKNII